MYRIVISTLILFSYQSGLFSQELTNNVNSTPGQTNLAYPQSVFVDSQNGQIWVSDFDHHRVLRFDVSSLSLFELSSETSSPENFLLEQNYPNPFNSETIITFMTALPGRCELAIYNILGQKIASLFYGYTVAKKIYSIGFNAGDLPSGIYLYSLSTSFGNVTKRMCLLK